MKERDNSIKMNSKGTSFYRITCIYPPFREIFHIKQTLFIILFIIYVYVKAATLFQTERKNNKQRKKIALFSP